MFGPTSKHLHEALTRLLAQPDFFTIPTRRILQFLCDVLRNNHRYVAMSPEELILRGHVSDFHQSKIRKKVDFFKHREIFTTMGLSSKDFDRAFATCVELGILEKTVDRTDPQADFFETCWKHEQMSLQEAISLLIDRKL